MLGIAVKHSIISKTLSDVRSFHGIMQKYFRHDKDIFSATITIRTFLTRCTRLVQPTSFLKPSRLQQNLLVRRQQTSQLDIDLNVQNNVIVYKYENNGHFRNIRIFGFGQLLGWSVLALYTYSPTFWEIFTTDIKFKEYMNKHLFRFFTFMFSIIVGPIMFAFIYALCARNVKYIILNKGGKTLSLSTYHMWKESINMNLPIEMIKSSSHRTDLGPCVPLKIKNKSFYYLVDKKGTFVNPKLFDHIVG